MPRVALARTSLRCRRLRERAPQSRATRSALGAPHPHPSLRGVGGGAQNPGAFFDVTVGDNAAGFAEGFEATVGWDPTSGFGTLNFPALKDVVLAL